MPSLDDVTVQLDLQERPTETRTTPNDARPADGDAVMMAVLAAVVEMALRSKRRQADLDAALRRAGIEASRPQVLAALDRLYSQRWVDTVVPLLDGGVLLSVTALGMEVAGRRRVT